MLKHNWPEPSAEAVACGILVKLSSSSFLSPDFVDGGAGSTVESMEEPSLCYTENSRCDDSSSRTAQPACCAQWGIIIL